MGLDFERGETGGVTVIMEVVQTGILGGGFKADWRPLWTCIVKLVSRYILHTLPDNTREKSPFLNDLQRLVPYDFAFFFSVAASRT
jgi:hypothetical protein